MSASPAGSPPSTEQTRTSPATSGAASLRTGPGAAGELASAVPGTTFARTRGRKGRMDVGKALFFFRRALNAAVPLPPDRTPGENK